MKKKKESDKWKRRRAINEMKRGAINVKERGER